LNKPTDYSRVLLGASLPLSRSLWQCDSCGRSVAGIKRETASRLPDVSILNSADGDSARDFCRRIVFGDCSDPLCSLALVAPAELAISKSLIRKNLITMRIGRPPTQKGGG